MSSSPQRPAPAWSPAPRPWGRADGLALGFWTAAIVLFFWDAATLRRALFYFDVTEINLPYRDFFARELRAGRFSRWLPGLYCGHPLYSESQAGYFHPLKYLLYPWMPTWAAFNLDTILSVWLTGLGAYGWLRRHVGAVGALTGAAVFGLGGFTWAHFVHTSMINALASVPLALWALESAWASGRPRPIALGGLAVACQVFAGHLQDAILTSLLLGGYGLARAVVEPTRARRTFSLGAAVGMVGLAVAVSAIQWVPSKELIDRSPRAGGLSWDDMTFGSWHFELLPTLVVREAYGTLARDTDWMDGFYPYHEMNAYLGVVGLALAAVGAAAYRDRWVGSWLLVGGVGCLLMLGRFTFLMDFLHRVPAIGSGRVPARYHLWVTAAVAVLAAVGADRLARPGGVRLGPAAGLLIGLALAAVPILVYVYRPAWTEAARWPLRAHAERFRWLGTECALAAVRNGLLALAAFGFARAAARAADPARRARRAAALPLLAIADLLGAHWVDVPTVPPAYWTVPPPTAVALRDDPATIRIYGEASFASAQPGHASQPFDFLPVRDVLAWSLPPVWGLRSTAGETPILSTRRLRFTEWAGPARLDVEGLSHILSNVAATGRLGPVTRVGSAYIHRNPNVLPRARLLGRPVYAADERAAAHALRDLGRAIRDRIVIEDPDRPLAADAEMHRPARIVREVPERIEVATDAPGPAYLFLAETFDPGWSATLDGRPAPVRPAYVAFQAVFVPAGPHTVVFTYRPAGWTSGLILSALGLAATLTLLAWRRPLVAPAPPAGPSPWPAGWPCWLLAAMVLIVLASSFTIRHGRLVPQRRWDRSLHRFTWGAGIEAMKPPPAPLD